MPTNGLITAYSKRGEIRLKCTWRWPTFNIQVEIIVATADLSTARDEELYVAGTESWYLLAGDHSTYKTRHQNFGSLEKPELPFFFVRFQVRATSVLVRPTSQSYSHYLMTAKKAYKAAPLI